MVNEGRFRKDLYYLLKAFGITLPKASERRMDLILLDEYYKIPERYQIPCADTGGQERSVYFRDNKWSS